jgi:hypothetical protein
MLMNKTHTDRPNILAYIAGIGFAMALWTSVAVAAALV